MLTALLPIRTERNSFWRSSKGMEHIEIFLNRCTRVSEIDQFVVITQDDPVCLLAEQQGIQISSAVIPGDPNRPYTFEETRTFARNFQNLCKNQNDALIIVDHRNLLLTADDITRALTFYQLHPKNGVISLAFCRDYPCQFKAFYFFLGCVIIRVNGHSVQNGRSNKLQIELPDAFARNAEGLAEIVIGVSVEDRCCNIFFSSKNIPTEKYIAQIIPFDHNGPLYKKSREILVKTPEHEYRFEIGSTHLEGAIFNFIMPSQSGEYDTLELFTPENAPWVLGESLSTVINKKNSEPMYGRRQFPPAYTFDGSLCILNSQYLADKTLSTLCPIVLENSCIVIDWVDYWYAAATQESLAKVGS